MAPTEVVRQTVGAQGGTVQGTGWSLDIPAGALGEDVEIVITQGVDVTVPDLVAEKSPGYRLEPEGQTFANPISFTIELEQAAEDVAMYWTDATGALQRVPTTVDGLKVTGTSDHFSVAKLLVECLKSSCVQDQLNRRIDVSVVANECVFTDDVVDCTALDNALTGACVEEGGLATCDFACGSDFASCDGTFATGCETSISTNLHCGSCVTDCPSPDVCQLVDGAWSCQATSGPCAPNPCPDEADSCVDSDTRHHFTGICIDDGGGGYTCASEDLDCGTDETCEGAGVCVAPLACEEDNHADAPAQAMAILPYPAAPVEGRVCGAFDLDADYFKVAVPEGDHLLRVRLRLTEDGGWPRMRSSPGPARLELFAPGAFNTPIADAFSWELGVGLEHPVTGPGDFVLGVRTNTEDGESIYSYRLDYDLLVPPDICSADPPYDAYEDNRTIPHVFEGPPPERFDAALCRGVTRDIDNYQITPAAACVLLVQTWSTSFLSGDLRDNAVNPPSVAAIQALNGPNTHQRAYMVVADYNYVLKFLQPGNDNFAYIVEFASACPTATCQADTYEPNGTLATAHTLPLSTLTGEYKVRLDSAACGSDVDFYGPLPRADWVNAIITFDPTMGVPHVAIVDATGAVLAEGTRRGSTMYLDYGGGTEGVYLRVQGNEGQVRYFLLVEIGQFS